MPRQPLETLALLPTGQMVVDYYSSNGNLNKYKRGKKGKEYLPIPIVLEAITGMDVWIFAAALLRQKEEILTSLIAWRLLHLHHSTKYIQLSYADHLLKDCHVHKGRHAADMQRSACSLNLQEVSNKRTKTRRQCFL